MKLAKHYKAIGQTRVYLMRDEEAPWALVTEVGEGSTYRHNTPVSVSFKAAHPCGLTFEWSLVMEARDASGKGTLEFDVKRIARVMAALPERAQPAFKNRLADAAAATALLGREWQAAADRQRQIATALSDLAR